MKPVYGHYTPLDPSNNIHRTIDKTQASIYSQYQTKLDSKWIGVVGARYDWVKTENKAHKKAEDESRNDGQMSLNAGLMYIADNGISPYLNYSQSLKFNRQSTQQPKNCINHLKVSNLSRYQIYTLFYGWLLEYCLVRYRTKMR